MGRQSLVRSCHILAASALPAVAQVPTRTFLKPDAVLSEAFSSIVAVVEVRGRVILADNRDNALVLVDMAAGSSSRIGREGSGPLEWSRPTRLLRMPGDTTYVFDVGNSRFLLLSPEGRPVRTYSPVANRVQAGGSAGVQRGGATAGGGNAASLNAMHADASGRMYFAGFPVSMTDRGLVASDSFPLLRQAPGREHADTIAFLHNPPGASQVSGSGQQLTYRVNANRPFEYGDGWTVFADGRVVIVRNSDYRLTIVTPDGRAMTTAAIPYAPVRVTEADKREWGETRSRTLTTANGRTVPLAGIAGVESWPELKSPIANNSVLAAPNGDVWVVRQRASAERVVPVDVFNERGVLVARAVFPPDVRPIAFGWTFVYAVRTDQDGLQYLQRYRL